MKKLYVEKRKSQNDKEYIVMFVDLGYKDLIISFKDTDIAQVVGCSVDSLYSMETGISREVATIESEF